MKATSSPSRIEDLPNEIFLEIFRYLHHFQLLKAWTNLNSRIDSLLHSTRSDLYLLSNKDLECDVKYMYYWAHIVVSLHDYRGDTNRSKNTQFESFNLKPFFNLRKLLQIGQGHHSLRQISPKSFPYLECLHFSDYEEFGYPRVLFDEPFPLLTSISGFFLNTKLAKGTTTNNIIRRIVVHFNSEAKQFSLFINFIKRLPNLTTLRVVTDFFYKLSVPSMITTQIRNLSIWALQSINIDEIEFLLHMGPVKRFYFQLGSDRRMNSSNNLSIFTGLAQVLNNCETLEHVELRVWLQDDETPNIEQIRSLSPWFTTLDLAYGYQGRKSLQTYNFLFENKHLRF